MTLASNYAETIAAELRTLEHAAELWQSDEDAAAAMLDAAADEISDAGGPIAWWVAGVLDVRVFTARDGHIVKVIRTVGGPHCEIVREDDGGRGRLDVRVWWGADEGYRIAQCDAVADWLDDMAEGCA